MENLNEMVNLELVLFEPKKVIQFLQVKVFATNSKYEQERCILIDFINNLGILDKYYSENDNVKPNCINIQKFV